MNRYKYSCIIIFLLIPLFTSAAGLDDAVNYKSASDRTGSTNTHAYTLQEIIEKLSNGLDEKGIFNNGQGNREYKKLNEDSRIIAFNKQNFGDCEAFYLFKYGSAGHGGLENTLRFIFPRDENSKINASNGIKHTLSYLNESTALGTKCENKNEYLTSLKNVFNAVIQARSNILNERLRIAEIDLQAVNQKKQQREAAELNRMSQGKAVLDDLLEKRNETILRNKKFEICTNTNEYKFYELTRVLEFNTRIIEESKLAIKQQEAGAKISGLVDKNIIHKMGIAIANSNQANDDNYLNYVKMGGTVKRKELVRAVSNPCTY